MNGMRLPAWAMRNHHFTLVVVSLLIVVGVTSYLTMPRSEDPQFDIPTVQVVAVLPGATPEDVESLVVDPLEDEIEALEDIDRVSTVIRDGLAVIQVDFLPGSDADDVYEDVLRGVDQVRPELPDALRTLDVGRFSPTTVVIFQAAFVSESASYSTLRNVAEDFEDRIERIPDVSKVDLWALPEAEVRVSVDPERLHALGLSISRIVEAIAAAGANVPGGAVDLGARSFTVRTTGDFDSIEDVRAVVVASAEDQLLRVADVARVESDHEDRTHIARLQGERAVFATVVQREGSNIFDVRDAIAAIEPDIRAALPADVAFEVVFDQSVSVDTRIGGFFSSLMQGIVLVGLVVLLALGGRASIVVIAVIPVSIAVAIGWVDLAGYGLQQISIVGLVIALGLLVDNAIVVTENVARYRNDGLDPDEAAVRGTSEVGWAIVAATLTSVFAFLPIVLVQSPTADFIRSLPVTVILALVASLLVSLTLTPWLAARLLHAEGEGGPAAGPLQRLLRRNTDRLYLPALRASLDRPPVVLGVSVVALAGALSLFPAIGVSFFPKAEKPQFLLNVTTPEGTSLAETDRAVREVEGWLLGRDEVVRVATNVGRGNPRIYYNEVPPSERASIAQLLIEVTDPAIVEPFVTRLETEMSARPGFEARAIVFENGPPVEAPIAIKVRGPALETLRELSGQVESEIRATPGTRNVQNPVANLRTDLRLHVDEGRIGLLGIAPIEIDRTVRAALAGVPVATLRDARGEDLAVVVRTPFTGQRPGLDDLERLSIASGSGSIVPLSQVATSAFEPSVPRIDHFEGQRAATVSADVATDQGYTEVAVTGAVVERLGTIDWPAGYDFYVAGTLEAQQDSFGSLGRAFAAAALAILAILVFQFRSFSQPLIIFTAVPFSVVGAFPALLITGYPFSFTAFIGFTSLVGIVVNNAIILVDYANQLQDEGRTIREAVEQSSETRFVPIVLTTLTTVGGLLPLTLTNSSLWSPLGWVIIGGLLVSTFLTLLVVPVLYLLFTKEPA